MLGVVYMHYMRSERELLKDCACHRLRTAARVVTRSYDEALRPSGLRASQFAVLAAATADEVLSITSLASFLGMDRSTLTRNLRPLESQGLVRVGVEGWRRSRALEITAKGRAKLASALPHWQQAQRALQRKLGGERWDLIRSELEELIRLA